MQATSSFLENYRLDYLAPLSINVAYAFAVEKFKAMGYSAAGQVRFA